MQSSFATICVLGAVLVSVSASTPEKTTQTCQFYDAVMPSKTTCNDPADLLCEQSCTGGVVSENCQIMGHPDMLPGKVLCDGAWMKKDANNYFCQNSQGSIVCKGPFTGAATCSGCRPLASDDNKKSDKVCAPRPCTPGIPSLHLPNNVSGQTNPTQNMTQTPEKANSTSNPTAESAGTNGPTTGQSGTPPAETPADTTSGASIVLPSGFTASALLSSCSVGILSLIV